jgi:hypothetical protein
LNLEYVDDPLQHITFRTHMLRATCCSNEILASSTPIGSIVSPPLSRARTVSCTRAIDDQQIRHARIERRPAGRPAGARTSPRTYINAAGRAPVTLLPSSDHGGMKELLGAGAAWLHQHQVHASRSIMPQGTPQRGHAAARRRVVGIGLDPGIQQGPVVPRAEQSQSAPELRLQGSRVPCCTR